MRFRLRSDGMRLASDCSCSPRYVELCGRNRWRAEVSCWGPLVFCFFCRVLSSVFRLFVILQVSCMGKCFFIFIKLCYTCDCSVIGNYCKFRTVFVIWHYSPSNNIEIVSANCVSINNYFHIIRSWIRTKHHEPKMPKKRKSAKNAIDELEANCKLLCDEARNHMKMHNYPKALSVYSKVGVLDLFPENADGIKCA